MNSSEYPPLLKKIDNPPALLHFRGIWNPELFNTNLAVSGSRKTTRYGIAVLDKLMTPLLSGGIVPVAGMMEGIDRLTHMSAVDRATGSIAVCAGGISWTYSREWEQTASLILEMGGMVLSSYGGETPPSLGGYHRRNRIIAALSPALLVIEAGEKSGALKLAIQSLKLNRKVFTVPAPLTSSLSRGTSKLLGMGAEIVKGVETLSDFFSIDCLDEGEAASLSDLDERELKVLRELERESLSADELTRTLAIPVRETIALLSNLCLKKIITFSLGKYSKGEAHAD